MLLLLLKKKFFLDSPNSDNFFSMKRSKTVHSTDNLITKTVVESLCVNESHVSTVGDSSFYIGPSVPLLSGISSRRTPSGSTLQLINGTQIQRCTRPVIPFQTSEEPSPSKILIHYSLSVSGHTSECSCGNCGYTFLVTGAPCQECDCGTDVFDEGKQSCIVM